MAKSGGGYIYMIMLYILIALLFIIIGFQINSYIRNREPNQRICCIYNYYEKDEHYKNNFKYFLENAIIDDVDFYIVINGKSTVEIPQRDNITVMQRENEGFDFGAWSHVVWRLPRSYDYYFFINTSVKGPYLRDDSVLWTNHFTRLFYDEHVKLVGTSIGLFKLQELANVNLAEKFNKKRNIYAHVQSMFFCITHDYLEHLKSIDFFDEDALNEYKDMMYVIIDKEIGLSQIALNKGWNINSILPGYTGLDYRVLDEDINPSAGDYGDSYWSGAFFGGNIDKYDAVFFKNTRGLPE